MRRALLNADIESEIPARLPRTNDLARVLGRLDVGRITAIADGIFYIEFSDRLEQHHPWDLTGTFPSCQSFGTREIPRVCVGVMDGRGVYSE